MYLVDTNVVSEARRGARADRQVKRWIDSVEEDLLYLSVITLLELHVGVLKKLRDDPPQGKRLAVWIDQSLPKTYKGRVLPVTEDVARSAASLHFPTRRELADTIIAATALVHDFTVVTRNTRHFEPTGVRLLNPFEETI